jgi:hypothetical protein
LPAPKAFIALEQTMASSLHAQWDKLAREIMTPLHDVLAQGKWQDAHALADRLTMVGVVDQVRPKLEELAVASLLFGAHHVAGSVKETSYAQGAEIPQAMHGAIDQLVTMIEQDAADYVRNQLHEAIRSLQQLDITSHFQKAEKSLADQLNDAVLNGGKVHIDIGANLTTSRLVSFGFLAEAAKVGVDEYRVNEVLDGKTCPVCRYMHGKRFKVANEYGRVLQTLQTSDPAELRSISPWPSRTKAGMEALYDMSLDELQAAGFGSPPYHPKCRGMLALAAHVAEEIPLGGPSLRSIGETVEANSEDWPKDRVEALSDAIDAIAGKEIKEKAQTAFAAGDYETALSVAQQAAEGDVATVEIAPGWTPEDIEKLKWERFDVTDAKAFKRVDDAFTAGDYARAQALIDRWKGKAQKGDALEDHMCPVASGPRRWRQFRRAE